MCVNNCFYIFTLFTLFTHFRLWITLWITFYKLSFICVSYDFFCGYVNNKFLNYQNYFSVFCLRIILRLNFDYRHISYNNKYRF